MAEFVTRTLPESLTDGSWAGAVIYADTETAGLDPLRETLLLVQLKRPGSDTLVIDFRSLDAVERTKLGQLLNSAGELVFHNASFDLKFLAANLDFDLEGAKVFCTQIAECVLTAGDAVDMRKHTSLASTYLRISGNKLDKQQRNTFIGKMSSVFSPEEVEYAAGDVEVLPEIRKNQVSRLKSDGLADVAKLEFELVKHVARMELTGVRIKSQEWQEFVREQQAILSEKRQALYAELEEHVKQPAMFGGLSINVDSPDQLLKCLRNDVGLSIEDTNEYSLRKAAHPICDLILDYRESDKLIKAFGLEHINKVNPFTGRLHAQFNQCLTSTGRFSSENPNLQQIPSKGDGAKLREFFVPAEGYAFVCADYSQIELRILAELSGEPEMVRAYQTGADIHARTASLAFGVPLEDVKTEQRKLAKCLSFGVCYGSGPGAVAKLLLKELSEEQAVEILKSSFGKRAGKHGAFNTLAKVLVDGYFENMPTAKRYLDTSGSMAAKNRESRTRFGRVRYYGNLLDAAAKSGDEALESAVAGVRRKGMNHPIQGLSADITKMAMVSLAQKLNETYGHENARMLMQVHDEIVSEVKVELAEEVAAVQQDCMVDAARQFLKVVPVEVDVHISDHWDKG